MGSHRVAGTGCVHTDSIQMTSIGAICSSTYYTKAKSIAKHISQLPADYLSREMEPFKDHPSTRGHLTSLRNKPQQKQPGQSSVPIPALIVKFKRP